MKISDIEDKHNLVISLSGGKDSTAMLLMLLEKGYSKNIHSIVFFDSGWDFPDMLLHIHKLQKYIERDIVILRPELSFNYWMYERPIMAKKGHLKNTIHRIGNGWPSYSRRWCTRIKVNTIQKYISNISDAVSMIGYASDEKHRVKITQNNSKGKKCFPLIDWNITEQQALEYCYNKGFNWNGLYNHFKRVSCFCCPLQRKSELKILRRYYPDLWHKMLEMDSKIPGHNRGFRGYQSVHELERCFLEQDRQLLFLGEGEWGLFLARR
ncbi:phosphoadenosine phosphosulfate reductase family protein [Desulfatirhabdium butyrativorans]|uniref:phosphoadenosine phosphosulfate reductase domain-containing protein n=1 Tax=Desulfatirhabdium butyrativorans TaxID=340467 RepID=UPI0006887363|nr:phosphoadenosine phosphosulfate reductase family protein [Desulfatirhabdium butyrativorans]